MSEDKTNNNALKEIRDALKEKEKQLKELQKENKILNDEKLSNVEKLKQIDFLMKKDMINTFGEENFENAQKLRIAGFDDVQIKQFLKKNDSVNELEKDPEVLKNIKGDGKVISEEEKGKEIDPFDALANNLKNYQ